MITFTSVFFTIAVVVFVVMITFTSVFSTIAVVVFVVMITFTSVFSTIAVVMITSTRVFFTIAVVMMFVMVVIVTTASTSFPLFFREFYCIEHTSNHKINNLIISYTLSCHIFDSSFELKKIFMSLRSEFEYCFCHGNIG